jgi:hypothetical protein
MLILLSSNHAMSKKPKEKPSAADTMERNSSEISLVINNREPSSSASTPTFLDTLNKGREVSLSDKDFSPVLPESSNVSGQYTTGTVTDGYRVQCMATSQIDKIRSEQKILEDKIKYHIYVIFNSPYYKLLIGDFVRKNEAETVAARLKEMGYADAWVTRSKINPAR